MSINDIEKSMKRAKSGGTYNFFKTKYIGLDEEAYIFEITFPRECLNPFQTVQGGMIASALDEITSISVNILTKDKKRYSINGKYIKSRGQKLHNIFL